MQAQTAPKLQTTKVQHDADAAQTQAHFQQADMMTMSAGICSIYTPTASKIVPVHDTVRHNHHML